MSNTDDLLASFNKWAGLDDPKFAQELARQREEDIARMHRLQAMSKASVAEKCNELAATDYYAAVAMAREWNMAHELDPFDPGAIRWTPVFEN